MTLSADLDTWADALATATGLTVTRDPARIYPPCLYVGLPEIVAATLPTVQARVPVWLVAAGAGKQAGDQLLDSLLTALAGVEDTAATPTVLAIGDVEYHAYAMNARIHITT